MSNILDAIFGSLRICEIGSVIKPMGLRPSLSPKSNSANIGYLAWEMQYDPVSYVMRSVGVPFSNLQKFSLGKELQLRVLEEALGIDENELVGLFCTGLTSLELLWTSDKLLNSFIYQCNSMAALVRNKLYRHRSFIGRGCQRYMLINKIVQRSLILKSWRC